MPRAPEGVQSVDRALTVLEILARRGHAGVSEVAGEMGIHKSTASRLLAVLEEHELVGQSEKSGHLELGFGVLRLAHSIPEHLDLVRHARPIMDALADELNETINIAVLHHGFVVNLGQSVGHAAISAHNWIGELTPPHATSSGKVLLAALPASERRTIIRQLDRFTDHTITSRKVLTAQLHAVTHNGYATTTEELEIGLSAISVPLQDHSGLTVAALSISGPSYRFGHEPTATTALQRAAHNINAHLGHPLPARIPEPHPFS